MLVCMCVYIVKFILITDQIIHRQRPVKHAFRVWRKGGQEDAEKKGQKEDKIQNYK